MIIPAILEHDVNAFNDKLKIITTIPGVKTVQVDFVDNTFSEKPSLPVSELAKLSAPGVDFEAHLMVASPRNFHDYFIAGFSKVIVHYESFANELALEEAVTEIIGLGLVPAIALSPSTAVTVLRYMADSVKHFTLLSVVPGRQGQSFLPETLDRIKELRQIAPDAVIEIDGGLNTETIPWVIAAGAHDAIVGSALLHFSASENEPEQVLARYDHLVDCTKN
jgi:ribulose-phosphate 3-epimerase